VAVTPKPKSTPKPSEAEAEKLIRKGGSIPSEHREQKPASVVLRIPSELLERVDATLAKRPIKVPRHQWLLEAIVEKLERDEVSGISG
jgi:predicted DNA binding CopG/RHH family protein